MAAAGSGSFADLRVEHFLQRRHVMPARERQKRFVARSAMSQITFEHALDGARRVLRVDVAINLVAERSVRPEAAADIYVISLDRIGILTDTDFASEQPDITDVMLRAGMMTTGEVNIDGPIEFDARLAPLCDVFGVTFGVGG